MGITAEQVYNTYCKGVDTCKNNMIPLAGWEGIALTEYKRGWEAIAEMINKANDTDRN